MKLRKIKIETLREIIRDFKKTGFEWSLESFEEWFGVILDSNSRNYVETSLFKS